MMSDYIDAAAVTDLPEGGKMLAEIGDQFVVLFLKDGNYYCIDDVCTHDGGPLSEGEICNDGYAIACPRHGAKFDVRTGKALTMPAYEDTLSHDVKVENGRIFVKLREE
jgi:3-phenylpropionate/trans-cinnamate dioxygenase ferredoxin subunit